MSERTAQEAKAVAILLGGFARGTKVYKPAPEQQTASCRGCALNTPRGSCVAEDESPDLCGNSNVNSDGDGIIWIEVT